MHKPGEADVRIRQRVVDGRGDDRADLRRDAARHLLRDEHVGQERPVRSVLFGRAGRNDDGVVRLQERFDFRVGHLAEKHRWRLHRDLVSAHPIRELILTDSIFGRMSHGVIEIALHRP